MAAHFQIPLDLPHAGTVAGRIVRLLGQLGDDPQINDVEDKAEEIVRILWPYSASGVEPPREEALRVRDEAAAHARRLVDEIERMRLGSDRLGQCVRNLFECLELGEEGATISLRAGEDPNSLQRPV